jgi:hypothetical protein
MAAAPRLVVLLMRVEWQTREEPQTRAELRELQALPELWAWLELLDFPEEPFWAKRREPGAAPWWDE